MLDVFFYTFTNKLTTPIIDNTITRSLKNKSYLKPMVINTIII